MAVELNQNAKQAMQAINNSPDARAIRKAIEASFGDVPVLAFGDVPVLAFGDQSAEGAWRVVRVDNDLEFQRLESGVWVMKGEVQA